MSSSTIIVLAVILSYFGVGFVFRKKSLSPFLGTEYLIVGYLFSLLKMDVSVFVPMLPPFIGVFGLIAGLQIKKEHLKSLPKEFYKGVFLYYLAAFLLFAAVFSLFFDKFTAFTFASVFSLVSYKVAASFLSDRKRENREILFFSAFVPFLGIIAYFLVFFFFGVSKSAIWLFPLSFAFMFFFKTVLNLIEDEHVLPVAVMGLILFFSEVAYIFEFSPLVSMFLVGYFLSNYCEKGDMVFDMLVGDEKQLYTMFLIFLGFVSGLPLSFSLVSMISIIFLSAIFVKFMMFFRERTRFFMFLSPGAFGTVFLADFWLFKGHAFKDTVLAASVISIILLQAVSMLVLKGKSDEF